MRNLPPKLTNNWRPTALALVIGSIVGGGVGFFLGIENSGMPNSVEARNADGVTELGKKSEQVVSAPEWMKSSAARFEHVADGQVTPGLKQAIGEVARARSPFDQSRMLSLIDLMRKEDFPEAMNYMRQMKMWRRVSGTVAVAFWQRFGELDPNAALANAIQNQDLDYPSRKYLEKNLFHGMARKDPEAAASAFIAHPELGNRAVAVEGLAEGWAETDPKAAMGWAQSLPEDLQKSGIYAAVWGVSNDLDISKANELVRNLPPGLSRDTGINSVKGQIKLKPDLPASQLLDFIALTRDFGARDRKLEGDLAARISQEDPYAAAEFFSSPLPGQAEFDDSEVRVVAKTWAQQDAKAAANWIKGKEQSAAYGAFAEELGKAALLRGDSEEARHWFEKVGKDVSLSPPAERVR
jgi:hypothetical protein